MNFKNLLFFFVVIASSAQSQDLMSNNKLDHLLRLDETASKFKIKKDGGYVGYSDAAADYKNINGSPYLFDSWTLCSVTDVSGNVYDSLMINYDLNHNELIVFNPNQELLLLDKTYYPSFRNYSTGKLYKQIDPSRYGFYSEVLFDSPHYVFIKNSSSRLFETSKIVMSVEVISKKFKQKDKYYMGVDGKFENIKLNKKSIYKNLPKKYARRWKSRVKNKVKLKTEEDYVLWLGKILEKKSAN